MGKLFKNSWALFVGYGVLMIAHGLQGNLLGVRAVIEEFNFIATGAIMSGYFVGYFAGANTIPHLVTKVGHIRVFAAFASMASLSILIHAVVVNPLVWSIARFLTGMSMVSIVIVTESWLNDRANNRSRGKLLSVYMFVTFSSIALGALLLNFSSPLKFEPFILISLLLSIALIPILLTKRKAPRFKKIIPMKIKELYKISPMGVVVSFCNGLIHSAIFSLTAVYAVKMGFSILEISLLIFLITIAGAIFQWPVGFISDKMDRRKVIVYTSIISAFFAFLAIASFGTAAEVMYLSIDWETNKIMFFIFVTIFAGFSLPIYAINIAHTNDYIPKEKFVAAGGGLQLVMGLGAIGGPITCVIFMDNFGPSGFFIFLIILQIVISVFGFYRMSVRPTEENPDSTFTPLPRNITPLGIELDPTTGANLSTKDKK
jgi:MFS family permease